MTRTNKKHACVTYTKIRPFPTTPLQGSTTMGKLEVRVTSVQIVTGFPAHVIIPEPPGWQPACNADNGIGPGATTWGPHTPPVTYGNKGNTPCTDYVSADEKVGSPSGLAIEKD